MIASFLITLREGIEAALIVVIILSYLKKVGADRLLKPVYYGIGAGILGSIGVGSLFLLLSFEFQGRGEQVFEGSTMFLAAAILTTTRSKAVSPIRSGRARCSWYRKSSTASQLGPGTAVGVGAPPQPATMHTAKSKRKANRLCVIP